MSGWHADGHVRCSLREIGFDVGLPRTTDEMVQGLRADYKRVGAVLKGIGFKAE